MIVLNWAHPRECGADRQSLRVVMRSGGSSPRVRGGLAVQIVNFPPETAHPRECGADRHKVLLQCLIAGSSPRVRGGLVCGQRRADCPGLIPASAGRTTD